MNPEYKLLEHDGKIYAYHYTLVTAEQAEAVREIAEFKYSQDEVKTSDVNELIRSGRTKLRLLSMRYLLREVINDVVQPFNEGKAETTVFNWLKTVPFDIFDPFCNECLSDFFLNSKRAYLTSAFLPNEKKTQRVNPLLTTFLNSLGGMKSVEES